MSKQETLQVQLWRVVGHMGDRQIEQCCFREQEPRDKRQSIIPYCGIEQSLNQHRYQAAYDASGRYTNKPGSSCFDWPKQDFRGIIACIWGE